jgi:integrase
MQLHDLQIKSWINNQEHFESKTDSKQKGLVLCFRQSMKTPVWKFRYQLNGGRSTVTIGSYSNFTLSQARAEAKKLSARVSLGEDVALQKQQTKAEQIKQRKIEQYTLNTLVDEYYHQRFKLKRKRHAQPLQIVKKHLPNKIGQLPLVNVKPVHIRQVLEGCKKESPLSSITVLSYLKECFKYAIKIELIEHSPAMAFSSEDTATPKARERFFSDAELTKLFEAMNDDCRTSRAVMLWLLTCTRKMELLAAHESEFDLINSVWTLPAGRTKSKKAIEIPLVPDALAIVKKQLESSYNGFLFPSSQGDHLGESTIIKPFQTLLDDAGLSGCRPHDCRRTAYTLLARFGVEWHTRERCLNHTIGGVERHYNAHDYFLERKRALELLESHYRKLKNGESTNVIPFQKPDKAKTMPINSRHNSIS